MKLYFAAGTCSFSPHIVLRELGLPYDLVRVNNRTKHTSEGGDFLSINPKGYVAALALDTGEVLTEGAAIVQYLADLRPEVGLAPPNGTFARARLQEWLGFITSELHAGSAPLFNQDLPDMVRDVFRTKVRKRLDLVETTLMRTRYLIGDAFSVADAYLFAILAWMPLFDIDLKDWPNISDFAGRIEARPSVAAARAREAEIPLVE